MTNPNTTNSELIEELRQGSEARHMANRVTPDGKELVEMIPLDWAVEVIEALIASKVEEAQKSLEYELNTEQCVKVATYMYEQWQEAMQPPLLIYKDFPTWLASLQSREQDKEGLK